MLVRSVDRDVQHSAEKQGLRASIECDDTMKVRPIEGIQTRFATSYRTWIGGACSVALSVRATTENECEEENEKGKRRHGAIALQKERLKSHECMKLIEMG